MMHNSSPSLIGLLIRLLMLPVILDILSKILQHDFDLLMHLLDLAYLLLAKLHNPTLDIHLLLLLLLLLCLLLLVNTVQLGNPLLRLSLFAISYKPLYYAVIGRLAASEIEEILDIMYGVMVHLRMLLKTFILQIQIKTLHSTNIANLILVLRYSFFLLT